MKKLVHYTTDECNKLLGVTKDTITGARDRAMIVLMWRCGLRVSEMLGVRVEDLDRKNQRLFVANGKGGTTRTVAYHHETSGVVLEWTMMRVRVCPLTRGVLICSMRRGDDGYSSGEPIQRDAVFRTLQTLAKRAGIKKRVHPHGLRHTYAVSLLNAGVSLERIRVALGHASLDATVRYFQSLGELDSSDEILEKLRPSIEA